MSNTEHEASPCTFCGGSGTVRLTTSHLGPDDYDFEEDCAACSGTGSAGMESIGRQGWAHDCDGEIEDRIRAGLSTPGEHTDAGGQSDE